MLVCMYGSAAQRVTCPHQDTAVPIEAVTITVLDSSGAEVLAATNATKSSVSTTLAAAASIGDKSITVTSATGITAGTVMILTSLARSETVTASAVSGTTVTLMSGVARDHAIGATLVGATIYHDVNMSTYDQGIYQAIFASTGWQKSRYVLIRVVDLPVENPIEYEDMRKWVQNLDEIRDSHDKPMLDDARVNAWAIVRTKLQSMGRDPDVWRGADEVRSVGGLLAAGIYLVGRGQYDLARQLVGDPVGSGGIFSVFWAEFGASVTWFDKDQDRAIDEDERIRPVHSRVGRGL